MYIYRDSQIFLNSGFNYLLSLRRANSDFGKLEKARHHPAHRLLKHYKNHGVPVVLADKPWTKQEQQQAVDRGPHSSAAEMIEKGQWMVLPYRLVKNLPGLRLSPIGVVPLNSADEGNIATADMTTLAFFFLLRPGEYIGSRHVDATYFRLCDISLKAGARTLNLQTATDEQIKAATFVTLEFINQKNAVRGEVIGLGLSGDPHFCPVHAAIRRVLHLRHHNATATDPIAQYYENDHWVPVTSNAITATLRQAVLFLNPATLGFVPENVFARSLRAAGAMALLCADVDTDIIRLLGRWRSDEMLRYLHVQAEPVTRNFAAQMLHNGNFVMLPNHNVPVT